jgi:hypothetical protein
MTRSGHSDFSTTGRYINLAGETFRGEAEKHKARVFGQSGTTNRHKVEVASPMEETQAAD